MKGNIAGLLQQAQKMQEEMKRAQEEVASLETTGQAGGGMVEVRMNGKHAILGVKIDPALADDVEMLEDLVTAAGNDAVNRIEELIRERMSGVTQGLNLPPGFKLPF